MNPSQRPKRFAKRVGAKLSCAARHTTVLGVFHARKTSLEDGIYALIRRLGYCFPNGHVDHVSGITVDHNCSVCGAQSVTDDRALVKCPRCGQDDIVDGVTRGCGIATVFLAKDPSQLAFDVRGQHCIVYKTIVQVEETLRRELQRM
jgi:hypothetical protein